MTTLDIAPACFPSSAAGRRAGPLRVDVRTETGLSSETLVTLVGSHDTASAVVAVPAAERPFAYIACGTWSLVGLELEHPVLTEASRAANFTNEGGVDDRVRYLRNVMGLWLLQESLRTWELAGSPEQLPALLIAAGELPAGGPTIDPDDPVFLPPGDMPARIAAACAADGQAPPASRPALVRCVVDSLAAAYARTIDDAARLAGPIDRGRPPRRGRGPQRAPLPADRRRLRVAGRGRPGRGHRAGQRPRPGPRARAAGRRSRASPVARPGDPGCPDLRAAGIGRPLGFLIAI